MKMIRMKMMVINYGDGQVHPKDVVGHLKSLEGSAAWAKNKKVTSKSGFTTMCKIITSGENILIQKLL